MDGPAHAQGLEPPYHGGHPLGHFTRIRRRGQAGPVRGRDLVRLVLGVARAALVWSPHRPSRDASRTYSNARERTGQKSVHTPRRAGASRWGFGSRPRTCRRFEPEETSSRATSPTIAGSWPRPHPPSRRHRGARGTPSHFPHRHRGLLRWHLPVGLWRSLVAH